ncbi:solute carrier family 35 member F3-like [Saccoglossus kowalevskii]
MSSTSCDKFRYIIDILVVIGIGSSWVCTTQLASCIYSPSYNGTFVYIWFSTSWLIACYPIYSLFNMSCEKKDARINWTNGLSVRVFFTKICLLCLLWLLTNYVFMQALTVTTVTDVSAIFTTSAAFLYLFTVILFQESFFVLRVTSFFLLFLGFTCLLIINGKFYPGFVGSILSLISALSASIYKVVMHYLSGASSSCDASYLLTLLGLCNLFCAWPIVCLLYYFNVEEYSWDEVPWFMMFLSSLAGLVFNCLIVLGDSVSSPVVVSLGTVIGIPINAVVDMLLHEVSLSWTKIMSLSTIIIGYIMMLLPVSQNRELVGEKLSGQQALEFDRCECAVLPNTPHRNFSLFLQRLVQHLPNYLIFIKTLLIKNYECSLNGDEIQ